MTRHNVPEALLEELRGGPDRLWTNYDGELVWTKSAGPSFGPGGFTDCCFADEPCERHALMAAAIRGTA